MPSANGELAVFILSHGRAASVTTIKTLRRCGYSGDILLIIDDEDPQGKLYFDNYGKQKGVKVVVFSKKEAALYTDAFDNLPHRRSVVYARNAAFRIAEQHGIVYFIVLDDDYTDFSYRFESNLRFSSAGSESSRVKSLDAIFAKMLDFYKSAPHLAILSITQNGRLYWRQRSADCDEMGAEKKSYEFLSLLD